MTGSSMTLGEYLRKIGVNLDGEFLRAGVRLLAQLMMEGEVAEQIGAAKYERTPEPKTQGNDRRDPRDRNTRVGTIEFTIPGLRQCSYLTLADPGTGSTKRVV